MFRSKAVYITVILLFTLERFSNRDIELSRGGRESTRYNFTLSGSKSFMTFRESFEERQWIKFFRIQI